MAGKTKPLVPHTSTVGRARSLRRSQTAAECKLWARLRGRRLAFKFRRQHPIGRFVVDYYCHGCRLVIEIDGDTHAQSVAHDAMRTEWLERHGYRVLRFTNEDVHRRLDAVLTMIVEECERAAGSLPPEEASCSLPCSKSQGRRR